MQERSGHQRGRSKPSKTSFFFFFFSSLIRKYPTPHQTPQSSKSQEGPFSPFLPQAPTQVRPESEFLGWGGLGGLFFLS